jgi:probable F420-dependent oxidoreductase
MKFGITFANVGPFSDPDGAAGFARVADEVGFESIWTVEHVVFPANMRSRYPYSSDGNIPGNQLDVALPDPLIWLSYVASMTTRIKLATGVLILPQRNPVVLAKELSTLDHLSKGRMLLGIGVGWLAEEFEAIGVPFRDRGRRADEYIEALRALWAQERATFHGEFATFEECILRPQPAAGSIPIHVGGDSVAGASRAGRLGDGYLPASADLESVRASIAIAQSAAQDAGRDPSGLEITAGGVRLGSSAVDDVRRLEECGVHRVLIPASRFYRDPVGMLHRWADEVIVHFGAST